MIADIFRQFYEYHFAENRRLWDSLVLNRIKGGKR